MVLLQQLAASKYRKMSTNCNSFLILTYVVIMALNGIEVARPIMDEQNAAEGDHKPLSQPFRRDYAGLRNHDAGIDSRNAEIRVPWRRFVLSGKINCMQD